MSSSPRLQPRRLLVLPLLALPAFVACSDENTLIPIENPDGTLKNEFVLRPEAVQADATVARDAVVVPGSITLPYAGHESLLETLKPGAVFFGDRAPGMPESNPLGFNVHVDAIRREGDKIIISTRSARLDELFETVNFEVPLEDVAVDNSGVSPQDVSEASFNEMIPISFNFGDVFSGKLGSGTTQASGKASLSGGIAARFNPRGSVRYEGRGWGRVPNLRVGIGCGLDLTFAACGKVEGKLLSGKHASDGLFAFDGTTTTVPAELDLPDVTIPAPAPPPLVLTMKAKPKLFCGLEYSRSVGVAYEYRNSVGADVAFGLQDGSPFGTGTFTSAGGSHRWEFALQGGLKLKCGVEIKMGIYLYESLGGYFTLKPGAELGVSGAVRISGGTGQQTTSQAQACAGFDAVVEGKYGLEASIGWFDYNKEWPIGTPLRFPLPFPVQACAANYQPNDGCAGKADGLYCSGLNTAGSYRCQGGATAAGGGACPTGEYCQTAEVGGTATANGEQAACTSTPPRVKELGLQFCPSAPEPLR